MNGAFLALDLLFFASTSTKLFDGGWFPLLIAGVIAFLMLTWRTGERIMDSVRLEVRQRSKDFLAALQSNPPRRLPGTAVVLGRMAKGIPLALTQNLKHNCCLHAQVLLVAVNIAEIPRVADEHRGVVTPLGDGVTRLSLNFGFMEQPDVPAGLRCAMQHGKIAVCDLSRITYFTGHETIIPAGRRSGMARWREKIFAYMHQNAQRPGAYFRIPSAQIMEIGIEFEI